MKRYKGVAVALCLSFITLAGCDLPWGGDDDMDMMMDEEEDAGIDVETAYPVVRTISQSGTYIGTIETGEKVSVTPRVGGYVKAKYHGLGDVVSAGDVLFTIDDSNLQLEKKKAEADVRDANGALAKEKADSEAAKFEANESLNTLDTKSLENYDNIQKAIRSEYEAQLDLYKACAEESLYKKEGDYLEDLIKKDKDAIENSKDFTKLLKGYKSTFDSINGAATKDAAKDLAVQNGVDVSGIAYDTATQLDYANAYLNQKPKYANLGELEKAISTSESAEETATSTWRQHESSNRTNDIAIIDAQVTEEKQKGNISGAQEDIALKRKLAADYEIFTKAKIWAEAQAKIAAGDASVLSANVKLSKAQIDLEIAEAKLKNTDVTSPVSGEIVECKVEDFGTVTDSAAVYTIIDTSKKKAVFYVTGEAKNNMSVGQTVTIDKGGEQFSAIVDQISDTPDEKKLLYRVSAILGESDKESLDAGTSVRLIASIKTSENALTVPNGVVYYDEGRAFVYVAKNGMAVKTLIETGVADDTDIEVVSGLSAEDPVIVSWSAQLQDKAEVNIIKAAEKIVVNTPDEENVITQKSEPAEEQPAQEADKPAIVVYVETTANVNVRKDPTTDSEKLETAQKGTRFEKTGEEAGGWIKISYNGGEAYISSDYVRECR